MSKIFISYRRNDSADVTGRIHDRLVAEFGRDAIFIDVDSIPFGSDFRKHLDDQVRQCQVLLAVIGPNWLSRGDLGEQASLDDSQDFVRIEIELALKREIPVIPLLVQGATMLAEDALPPSIKAFAYRHGTPVRSGPDFHQDMFRLIEQLKPHVRPVVPSPTPIDPSIEQIGRKKLRTKIYFLLSLICAVPLSFLLVSLNLHLDGPENLSLTFMIAGYLSIGLLILGGILTAWLSHQCDVRFGVFLGISGLPYFFVGFILAYFLRKFGLHEDLAGFAAFTLSSLALLPIATKAVSETKN